MIPRRRDSEMIDTHLDDLQSEMEAGSRTIADIFDRAKALRETLLAQHLEQAAIAGKFVARMRELRRSVQQQKATLSQLRQELRDQRRT